MGDYRFQDMDDSVNVQTMVATPVTNTNLRDMTNALEQIKEYESTRNRNLLQIGITELKSELNRFFNDSSCQEIIYTDNTDKMFFGMCVMPHINEDEVYMVLVGDDNVRINKYYVELDSKLFSPVLDLTGPELTACLLHEVGHIVKDNEPINRLRKNIANHVSKTGPLRTTANINYKELLLFGIKDSIRKMDSMFDRKDDELMADEFVVSYGYGDELESALEKITRCTGNINKEVSDKYFVLGWTLQLYNDIKNRRIPALYLIRKMVDICPSYYERKSLKDLETRIRRIDDDSILGNYVEEGTIMTKFRRNGIRDYENDIYELTMQARNVQREDDALFLMRKLNSHITVIEDYLETEPELSETDRKRFNTLLIRYCKIRDTLADKALYKDDYNRIYINYPVIRDYNGMKT